MFTVPVVKATRLIRTMRGQTRAQLIVAEDGQQYVVKYSHNPIGRRALANELISSLTLKHLGIRTPSIAFISADEEVLERNPEIGVACAGRILPPPLGLHFGCRYAGSDSIPIYDFFPDRMLSLLTNRNHFLGALVFDKWFSNRDARQAIFYRENAGSGSSELNRRWLTEMIDHESTFEGREWTFRNSPPEGLHPRLSVYGAYPTMRDFDPWLDRIDGLDTELFQSLRDAIPAQWIVGEEEELSKLLWRLQNRRDCLPELLEEALVYIHAKQGPNAILGRSSHERPNRLKSIWQANPLRGLLKFL